MGKDGIQLLRHCVRLLLVVATDLSSIRQSGTVMTLDHLTAAYLLSLLIWRRMSHAWDFVDEG